MSKSRGGLAKAGNTVVFRLPIAAPGCLRRFCGTVWLCCAVLLPTANAQAPSVSPADSSGADTLQEIIVTAQKRSENLQDVPIAISVVTADTLRAANIVGTSDLPTVVSGLSTGETASFFLPHLRGIGTTSFGPGIENPVALYVDGVYYSSQLGALTDLSDVSQISVLKGPQGTLFGRNATGGVIQMTTKDPRQELGGEFHTEFDNYLTSRNYAYVTGGLTSDLSANASVRYTTQGNGWGRNNFNGDEVRRIDKDLAARTKWVYTPTGDTEIRLSMDYSNIVNTLGGNYVPAPGTSSLFPGYRATSNPYDVDTYQTGYNRAQSGGISLAVQQNLSFAQFLSISAFRSYDFKDNLVVSATPVPGINIYNEENGREITQELQLVSRNPGFLQWAGGIYLFHNEQSENPLDTNLHGFAAPTPFSLGTARTIDTTITKSAAVYAQGVAELAPLLHLTLGVRDTWEERLFNGSISGFLVNGIPIGLLAPVYDESTRINLPTYRVAVDYKLTETLLGYVSYNRGFKSGGFNALNPANPPYLPEVLNAYEIGIKSELADRRLRFNAASFYYDYKNIQETNFTGSTENVYNGAAARLYGIDVDSDLRLSGALQLSASAEWLKSDFTNFPAADFSRPLPFGGLVQYRASAAGNDLPYAPAFTVAVGANYAIPVAGGRIDLNVTNHYSSGYFTEPDNYLRQPAYDFLNASIAWTSATERFSAKFWARNLLDKLVESQLVTGPPQAYIADYSTPPRTYGVTLGYRPGQ